MKIAWIIKSLAEKERFSQMSFKSYMPRVKTTTLLMKPKSLLNRDLKMKTLKIQIYKKSFFFVNLNFIIFAN